MRYEEIECTLLLHTCTVEVGVLVVGFVVLGLDDVGLLDVGRRVLGLDVGRRLVGVLVVGLADVWSCRR